MTQEKTSLLLLLEEELFSAADLSYDETSPTTSKKQVLYPEPCPELGSQAKEIWKRAKGSPPTALLPPAQAPASQLSPPTTTSPSFATSSFFFFLVSSISGVKSASFFGW